MKADRRPPYAAVFGGRTLSVPWGTTRRVMKNRHVPIVFAAAVLVLGVPTPCGAAAGAQDDARAGSNAAPADTSGRARRRPRAPAAHALSAERARILNALRVPVAKELKRPVVFRVDHLKVRGDWAFLRGVPRQPGGKPMEYRGTPYEQARKEGVFDDWICALLRRDKKSGKWRVVRYVIGATDVSWSGWDVLFKAPSAIFG